jgi:hypothetical protein
VAQKPSQLRRLKSSGLVIEVPGNEAPGPKIDSKQIHNDSDSKQAWSDARPYSETSRLAKQRGLQCASSRPSLQGKLSQVSDAGEILHIRKELVRNLLPAKILQHGADGQAHCKDVRPRVGNPDADSSLRRRKRLPAICETRYHHDLVSETVSFNGPKEEKPWLSQRSAAQAPPLAGYDLLPRR